jgi:hypothetical protein
MLHDTVREGKAMIAAATPIKRCQDCEQFKAIEQFRRRFAGNDDVRMNVCRGCHATRERERRARKKRESYHRAVVRYIRKCRKGEVRRRDYFRMAQRLGGCDKLMELMVDRLGGREAAENAMRTAFRVS